MSPNTVQEIAQTLDKVGEHIWCCDDLEDVFDEILQRVSRLEAQLHVQRSLQRTAKLLREQPRDTALPQQMATRVKHFIKFTYEKTNRGKGRPTRLRVLGCNDLKFCGLAYKLKDVLELPVTHFEFLVTKIGDFVHRHDLSQHLYRDEIDKAVNNKFDPEDDAIFKEFLKSHVDQRPAKRKRDDSVQPSIVSHPMVDSDGQHIEAEGEQQSGNSAEHGMGKDQSPTRTIEQYHTAGRISDEDQTRICTQIRPLSEACIGRRPTWNPEPGGSSQSLYQHPFDNGSLAFMPILYLPMGFSKYSGLLTSQMENICGPYLSNAMKTSYLWDGGVATHCFGVAFPSNPLEDAIVVMSISQLAATQLVNFIDSMPSIPSLHGPYIQQEH